MLFPAVYVGAAVAAMLLPVQGRSQAVPLSTDMLVCADNVHADFVLPAQLAAESWPQLFPWAQLQARHPQLVVFVGWGDIVFFRDVPEWADVRPGMVARALFGLEDSAVRFVIANPPGAREDCKALALDRQGRQALIGYITGSLEPASDGGFVNAAAPGNFEKLVLAKGRYSPFNTCNQWIANGLGVAGLPYARFAPFAFSVLQPLPG